MESTEQGGAEPMRSSSIHRRRHRGAQKGGLNVDRPDDPGGATKPRCVTICKTQCGPCGPIWDSDGECRHGRCADAHPRAGGSTYFRRAVFPPPRSACCPNRCSPSVFDCRVNAGARNTVKIRSGSARHGARHRGRRHHRARRTARAAHRGRLAQAPVPSGRTPRPSRRRSYYYAIGDRRPGQPQIRPPACDGRQGRAGSNAGEGLQFSPRLTI